MAITKTQLKEIVKEAILELAKSGMLQEALGSYVAQHPQQQPLNEKTTNKTAVTENKIAAVAAGISKNDSGRAKVYEQIFRSVIESAPPTEEEQKEAEKGSLGTASAVLEKTFGLASKDHWAKVFKKSIGK